MKGKASAMSTLHLMDQYKIFTHGGNYWRDNYRLRYWAESTQPVVYRNNTYYGYKLLRRLGDWCWLTQDPKTKAYLTVKFLSRGRDNDLPMSIFLRQHCSSPYVSIIKDHFTIPHHLSQTSDEYRDVKFDAIVYETTGTDLRRESASGEPSSDIPLSVHRREQCIRQVVQAVAHLHSLGVVHGDLHPGNVVLPPPTREHLERFLARPPLEHDVVRIDGDPTPPYLPRRVTEPENIGYGDGNIKLIDFGYAFRPTNGVAYGKDTFAAGTPAAPELLGAENKTIHPFKTESWYLGQLIYFVLMNGWPIFRQHFVYNENSLREEYDSGLEDLESGQDELMNGLPEETRLYYTPFIKALLDKDLERRLSIEDLSKDECFLRRGHDTSSPSN